MTASIRRFTSRLGLLIPTAIILVVAVPAARGQSIQLQTASGGITISGTKPNFSSGFGNVNGLGAGTPPAGLAVISSGVSGGVLYTTPYDIKFSGAGGPNAGTLKVYVVTNFANPATLILKSCYPSASCTSAANYTTISTNAASPTMIIPPPGVGNGTYTASLALFVSDSTSFTGSDSATLSFLTYNSTGTTLKETNTLVLNTPSENVQSAVRLNLATSPAGLTISAAADFSVNFGNVNALGIGPGAGLTVVPSSGGVIYSTPYLLQPAFSGFASSAATLKVYVSLDFVHPLILEARDASSSGGPFTAISKSSGSQTTLTSAASGGSVTRYLGLFVKDSNGPTAFSGADSATLTYTLTAP